MSGNFGGVGPTIGRLRQLLIVKRQCSCVNSGLLAKCQKADGMNLLRYFDRIFHKECAGYFHARERYARRGCSISP